MGNTMINKSVLKLEDLKMTSLEIAELTGKEHFHVMRDIDNILK